MRLELFIQECGYKKAAGLWGFNPRTVYSWKQLERTPDARQAGIIVQHGLVTGADIFEHQQAVYRKRVSA